MALNKYQEQWFANAVGRATNPDGVAGFQCVDTFHDYGMAIFGKGWQETSGWGNAKDLFWGPSEYYWHKIVNDPNDPNLIPQKGDVIVWGGTPEWGSNPYGHIAVVVSATPNSVTVIQQDGFLQVPMYVATLGYYEPNAGSVIGWLRPNFDDDIVVAPAPEALKPNERWTITGVTHINQRSEPKVGVPNIVREIAPGTREIFEGYIDNGDEVGGSRVWFKDMHGYVHSSAFTDSSTNGLANVTPVTTAPLAPNERRAGADGAILRSGPDKNASVIDTYLAGRNLFFIGYVKGTMPYPNTHDIWLVHESGNYIWAGGLDPANWDSLADLTVKPSDSAPSPAPLPSYDFELDIPVIEGIIVEKIPAHLGNVDAGNFPADPGTAICHWWNRPEVNPSIAGVIAQFQKEGTFVSAHYVVSGKRIIQMVSLRDRAYHARESNGWIGIEIEPHFSEETQATVRALLRALEKHYGGRKIALSLHKDAPGNIGKTECSALDLRNLTLEAPAPAPAPEPTPPPTEPAEPQPAPGAPTLREALHVLADWIADREESK